MRVVVMFLSRITIGLIIALNLSCTNMMDEAFNEATRQWASQAKVDPLPGVYEARGLIANEEELVESLGGAASAPHLVLYVVEISKVAACDSGKKIRAKGEQEFLVHIPLDSGH